MPLDLGLGEDEDLADHPRDVEPDLLRTRLLEHRAQMGDHLRGPVRVPDHAPDPAHRFLEVGLPPVEPAQARAAVGDHGGERLVQLVGQGSRQLPHDGEPRDVSQLGLRGAQRFLGLPAILDVGVRPEPLENFPPLVVHRHRAREKAPVPSVGSTQALLHLVRFLLGLGLSPGHQDGFHVGGVHPRRPAVSVHLVHRQAGVVHPPLVAIVDGSVGEAAPDLVRNGLGQHAEPALALAKILIGALALGDVAADRGHGEGATGVRVPYHEGVV